MNEAEQENMDQILEMMVNKHLKDTKQSLTMESFTEYTDKLDMGALAELEKQGKHREMIEMFLDAVGLKEIFDTCNAYLVKYEQKTDDNNTLSEGTFDNLVKDWVDTIRWRTV